MRDPSARFRTCAALAAAGIVLKAALGNLNEGRVVPRGSDGSSIIVHPSDQGAIAGAQREEIAPMTSTRRSMLVAALLGGFASVGHAQTCGSPLPIATDTMVDAFSCAQAFPGGPGAVLGFSIDHAASVAFATSAQSFDPAVCVTTAGDCSTSGCLAGGDGIAPAVADALPAGSYWIIVTASPFDAPGACGYFSLLSETQPADSVFDDGFE
ncbi:MAG TPA: hypothetical protein VFS55_10095 [Dokdonella sp.]|nr:hypothetical protein [Dokdonella sp.]